MNPRIQVEHTVTEEVTDVDLVQSQLRIAAGETLDDLGLSQDKIYLRGAALQCRITTEDPANGFRPDTGMISAYRSPGGSGIRLDGGTAFSGTEISAHFDSMLVKLTCRGRDFETAVRRARRAVAEFRIRGVATNIPFLQAVLDDPDFRAGRVTTSFIEQRPRLLTARQSADRGTRLLTYLADQTVNKPHGERPKTPDATLKLPKLPKDAQPAPGSKQKLVELGPAGFARWLRESPYVGVTDTTFRDAHQSLLATRVRTKDLLAAAPVVANTLPQLLSLECWGGATYDVALRCQLGHRVHVGHEPHAVGVEQQRALAADRLRDERQLALHAGAEPQHRRVELHELDVAEHRARPQRRGDAVAGRLRRVGGRAEHLADAARREHDRAAERGADAVALALADDVQGDAARAAGAAVRPSAGRSARRGPARAR